MSEDSSVENGTGHDVQMVSSDPLHFAKQDESPCIMSVLAMRQEERRKSRTKWREVSGVSYIFFFFSPAITNIQC